MEISFGSRLKHAWNALANKDPTGFYRRDLGSAYYYRPDRPRMSRGKEKSIVTSIFNRIALDVASMDIRHCRLDENKRYLEDMDSGLNDCLTIESNIDQTPRAFIQDVVLSMFDEGCVAIVPVDTTLNPDITQAFDVNSLRTGKILEWYPANVKVRVYNEKTGNKEEFASTVLGRFRNPHIMHKLESISMNSVSKFANRLWPTVKTYIEDNNKAPKNIMVGLAGLIRFYQIEKTENGYVGKDFKGFEYKVFDTPEVLEFMYNVNKKYEVKNEEYVREILSETKLWGEDLSVYTGMVDEVCQNLKNMGNIVCVNL